MTRMIGHFNPAYFAPDSIQGAVVIGLTASLGLFADLPAPAFIVLAAMGTYKLWHLHRTRWMRDGYLFDSPADLADLFQVIAPDTSTDITEITEVLATYGLEEARHTKQLKGPVLTRHLINLPCGTKLGKLPEDDIARDLGVMYVTVSSNVGPRLMALDVPREDRQTVNFADLMQHPAWQAAQANQALPVCPGVDVTGGPVVFDLRRAPHLLVGGTTGQGKSVFMNALLLSLMQSGADFRLMIGDGKGEDFAPYYGQSKHRLLHSEVTAIETEVEGIAHQITWLAGEMDRRFATGNKPYPIVYVVDELADVVMQDNKEQTIVKTLSRLAQKGRSAGIHMVLATQYPSADALPPLLRASIPSRAGLTVAKDYESKVVLGETGCEKLLGKGDCLLKLVGTNPQRMHGAFITDSDLSQFIN